MYLARESETVMTDALGPERTSEVEFRSRMPRTVGAFEILHVDGYRPGSHGSHATAHVVTRRAETEDFCTHRLIWACDRPTDDPYHWHVEQGEYDIRTWEAARHKLAERIARDLSTVPAPPMPEFSIGHDTRNPDAPYVAQHTVQIGRAASMREAWELAWQRKRAGFPPWAAVAEPYADGTDPVERYVVTLVVGYDPDTTGGMVTEPAEAARAALELTRDAQARSTVWHVFDRNTGHLHRLEQGEFDTDDSR
jgi:hypothetical protein